MMTVDEWLEQASADARQRGLEELVPILEGIANATRALRAAAWHDAAEGPTPVSDEAAS